MMRRSLPLVALALSASGLLAGCAQQTKAPVVSVKVPTTTATDLWFTLDGSATSDPNVPALPLSFSWVITDHPAASTATINTPDASKASFKPDVPGSYTVRLIASNGLRSASADATFTASPCGANVPVVSAVMSSLAMPAVGSPVQLSATVTDADNDSSCAALGVAKQDETYAWSFRGVPIGSHAQLSDPTGQTPSFTPDVAGDYVVRLVVTDSTGLASAPLDTTVTAAGCGPQIGAATIVPDMPLVGASTSASVAVTTTCPSSDAQSTSYVYAWSIGQKPVGSHLALANPSNSTQQLTPDVTGSYSLHVVVTDGEGRSSAGDVPFAVNGFSCGFNAPTASNITASLMPAFVGSPTQLSATVADPDNSTPCSAGQGISYKWSLVGAPAGSHAALNDAALEQPSLTPDVSGSYDVQLVVTDSTGLTSAPASFTLTANTCAPSVAPLVLAPTPASLGAESTLTATPSTTCPASDPNSGIFHYAWAVQSAPAGSRLTLVGSSVSTVALTPDVLGSYAIGVTITDGAGRSVDASTQFTVSADACGFNPPQIASVTASASPFTSVPVTITAAASDPDNGAACGPPQVPQVLTYRWSLEAQPAGSTASVGGSGSPIISFVPDLPGTYTVGVVVTDSTGLSTAQTVTFTASSCGAPVAKIGLKSPIVVPAASSVGPIILFQDTTLWFDASQSTPSACLPATTPLQYQWSVVSLPAGAPGNGGLNSNSIVNPSAGTLNVTGTYVYQLVVSDSAGTSAAATLTVTIQGTAPGVFAGSGNISISMATDPTTGNPAWAYFDQTQNAVSVTFCTANCTTTNPTLKIETIQSGLGSITSPQTEPRGVSLAYTPSGVPEVAYFVPNQCTFNFAWRQTQPTVQWNKTTMVNSPGSFCGSDGLSGSASSFGRDLSLSIRSDGLPGIAFLNHNRTTGNDSLSFMECKDTTSQCQTATPTFTSPVTAEGSTQLSGYAPSLKYTSANTPRVATYNRQLGQLYYSACDSGCTTGAWPGSDTVAADANNFGGDVGRLPSLALDTSDNPHIAYTDTGNGQMLYAECNGSCLSGGSWNQQVIDDNQGDYASLVLDSSGVPYVAYTDQPNQGGPLMLAVLQGNKWSRFAIDNSRQFFYTGLSVSTGPEIHIVYGNGSPGNRGTQNLYTAFGL